MTVLKLLSVALLLSVSVLKAGASEHFRSGLFFAPNSIHIHYQPDEIKNDGANVAGTWEHHGKFSVAPEFHRKSRHLGDGTLYDMRGIMRRWGLELPEGSIAVAAPKAKLVFVRSTPADLELAAQNLEIVGLLPHAISFDVQITANGEQKLFSGKRVGTQSGQKTELFSSGGTGESAHRIELAVDPIIDGLNPAGVRVDLVGSISRGSSQSRIATLLAAEFGKEVTTELSLNEHTEIVLQFTFRQKLLGMPDVLASEGTKKQAIAEIEADLLNASETAR